MVRFREISLTLSTISEDTFDNLSARKVAVFETRNDLFFLRTSLEICLRMRSRGIDADFFYLGSALTYREYEPRSSTRSRLQFRHRTPVDALKELDSKSHLGFIYYVEPKDLPANLATNNSMISLVMEAIDADHLSTLVYRGVNIGRGIASSLVSQMGDSNPILSDCRQILFDLASTAFEALAFAELKLDDGAYDLVVVHNGRLAAPASIANVAKAKGISVWTSEAAPGRNRFYFEESTPHDSLAAVHRIGDFWNRLEPCGRIRDNAAVSFLADRMDRNGVTNSFRTEHDPEPIPSWLKNSKPFVVFFTTSQDELLFANDMSSGAWKDQWLAISDIHKICESLGLNLVVRVHPNQKYKSENDNIRIQFHLDSLKKSGVTVFDSFDRIDSYQLLIAARIVVSVGSTIGAEAIGLGIPSICLRGSAWSYFGGIRPSSEDQLSEILSESADFKVHPSAIYPYFLYCGYYGHGFKFVQQTKSFWEMDSVKIRVVRRWWTVGKWIFQRVSGLRQKL